MSDKVLRIGSSFNWVKKVSDAAKTMVTESVVFTCSRSQSVNDVRRKLRHEGMTIWDVAYQEYTFTFRVEAVKAQHAQSLLGNSLL